MRNFRENSLAAMICAALLGTEAVSAQEAAISHEANTYEAAAFARFAPRTALDMVQRVPGFVIAKTEKERGLGQATGNVLINNSRVSGKNNDVISELENIPAASVVRIEVVDGASLDVPGLSGQVANVIVRTDAVSGQYSWTPEFRGPYADQLWTKASLSLRSAKGPFEYTIGVKNDSGRFAAAGETLVFSSEGALEEIRDDVWQKNWENPQVNAQLVYHGPGEQIGNLNFSYGQLSDKYREEGLRMNVDGTEHLRIVETDVDGYDYEIGGDYAFALGTGNLKLIGLKRFEHEPLSSFVRTEFKNDTPTAGNLFTRDAEISEQILRAEYGWAARSSEWQVAIEGAFNSLENVSELFTLNPAGTFDRIPLPGSSATVEEDRYEAMVSWSRPFSDKLNMQLSFGSEHSEIAQAGAGGITREFWRPKGFITLAYDATPTLDLNFKLQRQVGQLDFLDFLATVDFAEDQETAANPELSPPLTWHGELEAIRDLGAYGRTSLRVYGQHIDGIIDTIPIGDTGEALGNIDSARIFGADWTSTFNLEPLGWQGARVDSQVQVQESYVEDPLTGEERPISDELKQFVKIALRHDVQGTDWAWGAGVDYYEGTRDYRLTEESQYWIGPLMGKLFVEHKDVYGMTIRAQATNLLSADMLGERIVYVDRRNGPIDFIEKRDREMGLIFVFTVSGTF